MIIRTQLVGVALRDRWSFGERLNALFEGELFAAANTEAGGYAVSSHRRGSPGGPQAASGGGSGSRGGA